MVKLDGDNPIISEMKKNNWGLAVYTNSQGFGDKKDREISCEFSQDFTVNWDNLYLASH